MEIARVFKPGIVSPEAAGEEAALGLMTDVLVGLAEVLGEEAAVEEEEEAAVECNERAKARENFVPLKSPKIARVTAFASVPVLAIANGDVSGIGHVAVFVTVGIK